MGRRTGRTIQNGLNELLRRLVIVGCHIMVQEVRGGVDVVLADGAELGAAEWLDLLVAKGTRPCFRRGVNGMRLFAEGEEGGDEFVGHRSCGERLAFVEPTNRKRNDP